jgi:bleomycin hydrolase
MMKEINTALLKRFRDAYQKDSEAQVLNAALSQTDLADLAFVPTAAAKLKGPFSVEVKTRGVTSQERSGRCWLFAALNILREKVAEKCEIEQFELSQNYLSFYDKLEKANNFLQMVIDHADEPIKGQLMQYVLRGMSDGGYWCEAADLIEKYGVVPKSVQPETYQSGHTACFVSTVNRLLRKDAQELRALVRAGKDPYERKQAMLAEIYKAECIAFGEPVTAFDFEYRDKEDCLHQDRGLTPLEFYHRYDETDLKHYIAVLNEPTFDKPLNTPIQFHGIENMTGRDMKALNLSQKDLEALCIAQLKGDEPVWFACDAGAFDFRKAGVWDPDSSKIEGLLGGFSIDFEKGDRLSYNASSATHAMLLTGVHFDEDGQPDRWKIENSWGEDVGEKGYFVCSEKYFQDYVYEAVIDTQYLTPDQRAYLKKEPVPINAWDEDY